MRRIASAIAMAALLAASPSRAFDAAGADIIGLHIGMRDAEVVDRLARQGYTVTRAPGMIGAQTLDGQLQVSLSAERGVTQIAYTFNARSPGVPAKLREVVIDRFGEPDQAKPMTWCRAVGGDGMCPANQASLTYLPDSLTLLLTVAGGPSAIGPSAR